MWPIRSGDVSVLLAASGGLCNREEAIAALQQCREDQGTGPSKILASRCIFISRQGDSEAMGRENCTGRAGISAAIWINARDSTAASGSGVKPASLRVGAESAEMMDQLVAQPALLAMEYSLAQL